MRVLISNHCINGKKAFLIFFLFLICTTSSTIRAQTYWLPVIESNSIGVEYLRPNFANMGETSLSVLSSTVFLSGNFNINESLKLRVELPFSHISLEGEENPQSTLGNPYLGLRLQKPESKNAFDFGLRAGIGEKSNFVAVTMGLYSDIDRFEAFNSDIIVLYTRYTYEGSFLSNGIFHLGAGPSLWMNTRGGEDVEVFVDYRILAGYDGADLLILGGLTGRWQSPWEGFQYSNFNQLGINISYKRPKIIPGIHFRYPLDEDFEDYLNWVWGINVLFKFGQ